MSGLLYFNGQISLTSCLVIFNTYYEIFFSAAGAQLGWYEEFSSDLFQNVNRFSKKGVSYVIKSFKLFTKYFIESFFEENTSFDAYFLKKEILHRYISKFFCLSSKVPLYPKTNFGPNCDFSVLSLSPQFFFFCIYVVTKIFCIFV